jgi:FSR family fosmidomycin resistance protein-like MFS transporter
MSVTDTNPTLAPRIDQPRINAAMKTFVSIVIAHALIDMCGGMWPIFKKLANLDLVWAGVISTLTALATTGFQPWFGFQADRGHRRKLVVIGVVMAVVFVFLGPVVLIRERLGDPLMYVLLFVLLLVIRMGQSMFHPPATSIAGNTAAARRSTAVSVFIACGMLGYASSWLLFASAYTASDGDTVWLLLPLAPVLVFIAWWCRPVETRHERHVRLGDVIRQLSHVRGPLIALYFIQMLISGLAMGMQYLLPEFLEMRGYPAWLINGGAHLFIIGGGGLLMLPAGHVADRIGRRRMILVITALMVVAYGLFVTLPELPLPMFILLCVVTGGTVLVVNPIGVSLAQQLAPNSESLISGIMMGFAWAPGALTPTIVGLLAEKTSLGVAGALQTLLIIPVVCVPLTLMLPKRDA